MPLSPEMVTAAPMPAVPAVLTNGTLAEYVVRLQTALRLNIDKLNRISRLQPKAKQ